MATHQVRRFSQPQILKSVAPSRLCELLAPFRGYLASVGLQLPEPEAAETLDCYHLARIFAETGGPAELVRAVHYIDEMADTSGMDQLLDAARSRDLPLPEADSTPADVAVHFWLHDRELLERTHAEQQVLRPRSFEYFQAGGPAPAFEMPGADTRRAMEAEMDDWFAARRRGRGVRIFATRQDGGIWFLIRHGEPYRREGRMDDSQSPSVFYRPEKFDVVVYRPALGELRINAKWPHEKEFYRRQFGKHLFGNEAFFPGRAKYTLDPLREGPAALTVADVPGLEWVRLTEAWFYRGGELNEVEIHKADDLLATWSRPGRGMPAGAHLHRAGFQLKFCDSRKPRSVVIRPSNVAQYTRDADGELVEQWLTKRGFILGVDEHDAVLASR